MASLNVLLLPEPGSGHLMSLIEAGKRLLGHGGRSHAHEFTVTVLVVRPPTPESATEVDAHVRRVEASGIGVRFHHLPAEAPPTDCGGNLQAFKSRYLELYKPHVRAAARELRASALVIDFFATTVLDVARELAVPAYVYFTSTAGLLALTLRLPALEREVDADFEEYEGTVDVPGLPPVPAGSIPGFMGRKSSPNFTWFVYHGKRFMDPDGIIVNTAAELEPGLLASIAEGRCVPGRRPAPPLYPIGPVLDLGGASDEACVRWLDAQPRASVVFLCFGSLGWFDAAKAREVAAGLERSGARPPGRGRLRDALRVELDAGEPVARRPAGAVAAVRGAAPERVRARGRHGRGRAAAGGQEAGQLGGGRGAGAGGAEPDGWWVGGGAEGAGEGRGDEGRVPEGRGGGRVVARRAGEAAGGDPRGCGGGDSDRIG
ncbi:hypothetical protein PVAP13_2KG428700 [Panicum virgatum]|uniref:Uncharacterized protein n=1 Tax=Panicum virgatum TaxID=38727 RepID=A0A8T0WAI1_PANVG|nr:hypothetical protein PVAP13_2KG428700 [Panicum virgatum]